LSYQQENCLKSFLQFFPSCEMEWVTWEYCRLTI
jgi:hypothetical protein